MTPEKPFLPNGHTFPRPGHLTRLPCLTRPRPAPCGRDPASATPASAIAPPASSTGPGTWPSQTSEITIAAAGSNTSCAEMIQRACARAGFVPRVVARATDFAVLLSLVAAGAGLTLVPDLDALTEAAQDLPAAA